MLIIVEGPDGSGKSTLVRKIRELGARTGTQFWCLSSAGRYRTLNDVMRLYSWVRERPHGVRLLFDRFPLISERIYGPVIRNSFWEQPLSANYSEEDYDRALNNQLRGLDADPIIVYTRVPFENLIRTVRFEEQMKGVIPHIQTIHQEYESLMKRLAASFKVLTVDPFSEFETDRILTRLSQIITGSF